MDSLALLLLAVFGVTADCQVGELSPCPMLRPLRDVSMQELEGDWYLKILVTDALTEDFSEFDSCVRGRIEVVNASSIVQTWEATDPSTPTSPPDAALRLTSHLVKPGVWTTHTPLGGNLKAVLFAYREGEMAGIAHCGWVGGELVHLWTAAVTRDAVLSPGNLIAFNRALQDNGYDPTNTKFITWATC